MDYHKELSGRMWHGSGKNPLDVGVDPDQGAVPGFIYFPTFLQHCASQGVFSVFINFPGNNSWTLIKNI